MYAITVKKSADEDTDYSCWNDEGAAKDVAMEANYITEGDNHYCPKCYSYDDDDNLVIKSKQQICYKSNEVCAYDCKGLCKDSM